MKRRFDIEEAEKHVQVCTDLALRYTLTHSRDGQALLLAQDIMAEVRVLALGLATDPERRNEYIARFFKFIELDQKRLT